MKLYSYGHVLEFVIPFLTTLERKGTDLRKTQSHLKIEFLNRRKCIALMLCKNTDFLKCCNAEIQKCRILPNTTKCRIEKMQRRVIEVSNLSLRAKMAIQIFVRRVIAIFATNAHNCKFNSTRYAIYVQYIPCSSAIFAQSISKSAYSAALMQS